MMEFLTAVGRASNRVVDDFWMIKVLDWMNKPLFLQGSFTTSRLEFTVRSQVIMLL